MPILPTPKYDPYRRTFFDTARQANRAREEIETSDVYIRKDIDDSTMNSLSIGSASPPAALRLYVQEGLDADANAQPVDPLPDGAIVQFNGDATNNTILNLLAAVAKKAGFTVATPSVVEKAGLVFDCNSDSWQLYIGGVLALELNATGLYYYGVDISSGGGISALTGDVTASGSGSVAATIPNNTITYAKMQDISAAYRLLGSTTASGDPAEIAYTAFFLGLFSSVDAAAFRTAIGAGTGAGTVTSAGLTLPADMTVTSSPITTSGTIAVTRVKPRWDILEPPSSPHAKNIEFTQGFSSTVSGTPTGLTDDDQGSVMSPSSTKWGYTMLHDGTATRVAGGYIVPPTTGSNGVFTCYAHVSMGVERTTSGRFAVGLQIVEDTTITTARRRGLYIMQSSAEGSMTHTTHTAYNGTPSVGTTHDYFGRGIIRFIRDYVAGTVYWTYSLSLDGESWFHFNQTTEQWTIGGIGPYVWTDASSAGKTHTGYCKFIRFLDVADYFSPCLGRWIE